MNKYKIIFALLITLTILPAGTFAQKWEIYTEHQGLVGRSVNSMLTDRNGDIWIATANGISRFNGEWKSYREEDGLVANFVRVIAEDSDGMIWIGTGGGISKIDPNSDLNNPSNWHNYTVSSTDSGLSNNIITSILFDRDGKIWFGTYGGGISVVNPIPDITRPNHDPLSDAQNWSTFTTKDGIGHNRIKTMEIDAAGNIWIATADSINIYEIGASKWRTFRVLPFDDNDATTIFRDRKGNMWISGVAPFGLYKVYPNNLSQFDEHFTLVDSLASENIPAIFQDHDGAMWFGYGRNGVGLIPSESNLKDWKYFREIDGLASDYISSIIEDSEKNIWFGHLEERGVSKLDRTWLSFLTQGGKDLNFVYELFFDNQHNLWIGTDGGVVRIKSNANLLFDKNLGDTLTIMNSGLLQNAVKDIFQDSQSFLWFATDFGVSRVAEEEVKNPNNWVKFNTSNGLANNSIRLVAEDKLGYLWFATTEYGVTRVHIDSIGNKNSWKTITKLNGLSSNSVFAIQPDRNDNLWFATNNGVSFFDPTQNPTVVTNWTNYDTSNGLINNEAKAIHEDFEGNIWFATEGGVSKIDPNTDLRDRNNWQSYTTENGLKSNFVTSITQLEPDEIWFGTAVGASKFELNNAINPWTIYTVSSGLKSNFIQTILADPFEGNIWFGTNGGGVTRYKPQKKAPNTFIINKHDIVTENNVTFNFKGVDILTPAEDLRFWYTLDFKDTIETSDNFATIFIEDSDKPERHVFQVTARDRDGNVDPSPAMDEFYVIDPQYGSNVEIADNDTSGVRLFIPPGVLGKENSLTIKSLKKYELPDTSNVAVAYQIVGYPEEFVSFNKPATLAISFLNSAGYNRNELAIYRFKEGEAWDAIGGTIKSQFDTLTITTSITDLGIYAVRNQAESKLEKPSDEITIQPRIFSPTGDGQGHGDRANISFFLKDNSNVTVKVYNIAGRLKKLLTENEPMLPGTNAVVWDGQDGDGNYCVSGLYIVTVETEWDVRKKKVMVLNKYQ